MKKSCWEFRVCVIIDACMANHFGAPIRDDAKLLVKWAFDRKGRRKIATGGKLTRELYNAGAEMRSLLVTLQRAGRLRVVLDQPLEEESEKIKKSLSAAGYNRVDDQHVLAVAKVSGARLVFTEDRSSQLEQAFTDSRILQPAGKVYRRGKGKVLNRRSKQRLLDQAPKCD